MSTPAKLSFRPAPIAFALALAAGCAPPPPKPLPVRLANGPVRIDGAARESDWKKAPPVVMAGPREYGDARLLWDGQYLYLTATCALADRITRDSLILQIAGGGRRVLFKFEPNGACWDLRTAAPKSAVLADELIRYATRVNGKTQWAVEARIPLAAFGAIGNPVTLHLSRLGAYRPPGQGGPLEPVQSEQIRRLRFGYGAAPAGDGADAAVTAKP